MTKERADFWNLAGAAGLIMAGVSVAFFAADQFLGAGQTTFISSLILSTVQVLMKIAKIVTIVCILKKYMKAYASTLESATPKDVFRFGLATCALSSLVVAGAALLYFSYLVPANVLSSVSDMLHQSMMTEGMSAAEIEKAEAALKTFLAELPSHMFWGMLIYCNIWGLVLSAILKGRVCQANPFNENEDEQDYD